MIRQQHLGEIQWYLNLLSLTPTQLAAICGTTEDLTHLFTISPLLFLSFITLKAPTWKNQRSLYNNHKDEGCKPNLNEHATKFKKLPGLSHFYLVWLQGKNLQTSLSDYGEQDVQGTGRLL